MVVYFKAQASFTDKINQDFWRLLREDKTPFKTLSGVGGARGGMFKGTVDVEEGTDYEEVAYSVTGLLVKKIEELSTVGVASIEFEALDYGTLP